MRTVECPSQEAVMLESFQASGVGRALGFRTAEATSSTQRRTNFAVLPFEKVAQAVVTAAALPAKVKAWRREYFFLVVADINAFAEQGSRRFANIKLRE